MARFNLRPRPKPSKAPFPFLALPTELRLQIYNYLLLLSVPSYSYRHADMLSPRLRQRRRRPPFRRHGMLLANRQLHAEYVQAFYERTNFSFYADTKNGTRVVTVPFLTLPPVLLPNLRQCKLCVDLGILMWGLEGSMMEYVARIEALLGRMERVRWVHLVWDHAVMGRPVPAMGQPPRGLEREEWLRELWRKEEEELWELLGEQFVQRLKGEAGIRGIIVTVGKRTLKLERKGVEWIERE